MPISPLRTLLLYLLIAIPLSCCAAELQTFDGVALIPTPWADGDSFRVRLADGNEQTLRLYGADCLEWHVTDDADGRRLRDQRRYFGISAYGGSALASITLARAMGEQAATEVRRLLARPFRVDTAFADARGDARFKRVYAFVTTADGEDLATTLVSKGLARAHGVYRGTPSGEGLADYRERLRDAELLAARAGRGVWANTDWNSLSEQRLAQRTEDAEDKLATAKAPPKQALDLNTAARDELMQIPGVGEVTANAIIEARPYRSVDGLLRVPGIGTKRFERMRPWVAVAP